MLAGLSIWQLRLIAHLINSAFTCSPDQQRFHCSHCSRSATLLVPSNPLSPRHTTHHRSSSRTHRESSSADAATRRTWRRRAAASGTCAPCSRSWRSAAPSSSSRRVRPLWRPALQTSARLQAAQPGAYSGLPRSAALASASRGSHHGIPWHTCLLAKIFKQSHYLMGRNPSL